MVTRFTGFKDETRPAFKSRWTRSRGIRQLHNSFGADFISSAFDPAGMKCNNYERFTVPDQMQIDWTLDLFDLDGKPTVHESGSALVPFRN